MIDDVLYGRRQWGVKQVHVMDGLGAMPDGSVSCVVTSIPYWGLRAYGTDPQVWGGDPLCQHEWQRVVKPAANGINGSKGGAGHMSADTMNNDEATATRGPIVSAACQRCDAWLGELGSEPTIPLFVDHIVAVFNEVRRVLHSSGTCWLNVGDSYAGSGRGPTGQNGIGDQAKRQGFTGTGGLHRARLEHGAIGNAWVPAPAGTKAKDLCLIPERLALALQEDGWWVRSRIAWCKTSAMPESVTDRPTSAWEHIWLLTKSGKYFYDAEAVRQEDKGTDHARSVLDGQPSLEPSGGLLPPHSGIRTSDGRDGTGANLRNYWVLGPEPFRGAHFATFPTELVRRCIRAGSSERGVCPECGAPWQRTRAHHCEACGAAVAENAKRCSECGHVPDYKNGRLALPEMAVTDWSIPGRGTPRLPGNFTRKNTEAGWEPTCKHDQAPSPSIVLDPFSGAGTTAMVALRLDRRAIGLELNPEYVEMSRRRIIGDAPLLNAEIAR